MHFRTNMAWFLVPEIKEKTQKGDSKRHQKSDRFLHRFLDHFGSIWDAKLGPCCLGVFLAASALVFFLLMLPCYALAAWRSCRGVLFAAVALVCFLLPLP